MIIEGKSLPALDSNGTSDPYVIVRIDDQHFKTKTIEKSLDPTWNESFTFEYVT
jgi:Ca2+-dependent lipid-binding protein